MAKKKDPQSWSDKLDMEGAADPAPEPAPEHNDPVIEKVAATLLAQSRFDAGPEFVNSTPNPGLELSALKARYLDLEIRAKELELGLYLAKAKICEFELEKLRTKRGT